ncbi:MAG: hypothetical protein ACLSHC_08280 [Bilophila wadsworthia]
MDKGPRGCSSACSCCRSPFRLCVGMLLSRIGVRRAILGLPPARYKRRGDLVCPVLSCPSRHPRFTGIAGSGGAHSRHVRHCRHVPAPDLNRALAGCDLNLVGSLCGRIIGGWAAQMFGWRATLAVICFLFPVLLFIRSIPEMRNASARLHSPREYLAVFKGRGSLVSFSPKPAVSLSSPPSATLSLSVWRNWGRAT